MRAVITSSNMQRKTEAEGRRRELEVERAVTTRDDTEGSDSVREELYHALSSRRTLASQIYFFSIFLFTALLLQRRFSPSLVLGMPFEASIAFAVVTIAYYNVILLNSAKVMPSWVMGQYQQAGAMGVWLFTACWMVLYTTHIPPSLHYPRQWAITVFFLLFTLAMSLLSKVA